jgi:hypothetical protein
VLAALYPQLAGRPEADRFIAQLRATLVDARAKAEGAE